MKILKWLDFVFENKKINYKNSVFLDDSLIKLTNVFSENNYKLYVVGGAVRDMILNKTPKDIDLVTDAVPDEVEKILEKSGIKSIPTGKAFGVITAIVDGADYEIATFREDLSGGRRPDGVSFTDIETDVKRRDLTINALYYDLQNQQIIDLVGGYDDVLNNKVKAVGNAKDRFAEDRLRILRAVRFAGRFNSELDSDIDKALKEDSLLTGVSYERIRDEFYKGIKTSKEPLYYLETLKKYKLFDSIFPNLEIDYNFIESNEPIFVVSSILKNNDIDILKKELNKLKYPDKDIKDIVFLIQFIKISTDTAYDLKKQIKLTSITPDDLYIFGKLNNIDMVIIKAFNTFNLTITGEYVSNTFGLKGKDVGDKIKELEILNFKKLL